MCLITKNKLKKAEEDIICYKAVMVECNGVISSIVIGWPFLNWPKLTYDVNGGLPKEPQPYGKDKFKYGEGFIHATKNFTILFGYMLPSRSYERAYRCIIPKGTEYVEDEFGNVCAREMIVDEDFNMYDILNNALNKILEDGTFGEHKMLYEDAKIVVEKHKPQ